MQNMHIALIAAFAISARVSVPVSAPTPAVRVAMTISHIALPMLMNPR